MHLPGLQSFLHGLREALSLRLSVTLRQAETCAEAISIDHADHALRLFVACVETACAETGKPLLGLAIKNSYQRVT